MEQKRTNVVGRRIGGGFEIDSVIEAQRQEAIRFRERQEEAARREKEKQDQNRAALEQEREEESRKRLVQSDGVVAAPSGSNVSIPTRTQMPHPTTRVHKHLSESKISPEERKQQNRRRQECQSFGFPTLWSYSQTHIACEELSQSIGDLAFSVGGEKVFSSPAVIQAYKEMNLSCLQDPLIAPMVARINEQHAKKERQDTRKKLHDTIHTSSSSEVADDDMSDVEEEEEEEQLGVEHFAVPPHELDALDPLHPPLDMPSLDILETVLSHSTLSTAAERRGLSTPALKKLHERRAGELFALLRQDSQEKVVKAVLRPREGQNSSTDGTAHRSPSPLHSNAAQRASSNATTDAIQVLFWYVYCSFFHHTLVPQQANHFFTLSKALLAVELSALTLRNHRLLPNGDVDLSSAHLSSSVVEHADNRSTPLDFFPYVLIHATCFLFPWMFPASHSLFTIDFFNRASMLMNLLLTGTETDAQYWESMRKQFFAAPQISVDDIANAAELARSERERLMQRYRDDKGQLQKMANQQRLRLLERQAAMLKVYEGPPVSIITGGGGFVRIVSKPRDEPSPVGDSSERGSPRRGRKGDQVKPLYRPPLESMELGDPLFNLLNDSIYDTEYAQDLIRKREAAKKESVLGMPGKGAIALRAEANASGLFEVDDDEQDVPVDVQRLFSQSRYLGHHDKDQAATFNEMKQRFHPSAYPLEALQAQETMERNVRAMRNHTTEAIAAQIDSNPLHTEGGGNVSPLSSTSSFSIKPSAAAFIVRFTPLGIKCSVEAERMARSYREICKRLQQEHTGSFSVRSSSPLQETAARAHDNSGPQLDSSCGAMQPYWESQVSLLIGSSTVSEIPRLGSQFAEQEGIKELVSPARRRGLPQIAGAHRPPTSGQQSTSNADPVIEELGRHNVSNGHFGEHLFHADRRGEGINNSQHVKASAPRSLVPIPSEDAETSAAVGELMNDVFPVQRVRLEHRKTIADCALVGERDSGKSAAAGYVGVQPSDPQLTLTVAAADNARDSAVMPLSALSQISRKFHEVCERRNDPGQGSSPTTNSPREEKLKSSNMSLPVNAHRSSPSLNATLSTTALPHVGERSKHHDSVAHRSSSAALAGSKLEDLNNPRPQIQATRRSATPSSRPHCTIVVGVNAAAHSPAAHAFAPSNRSGKTSDHWLRMTQTVNRTRQYIDDAVRIHNAQDTLRNLVEEKYRRDRETEDLRQRAVDKTFEDEMHHLRTRITDPLQRSALVNQWIAKEPARRVPDREKHAALLKGTLLAEQAVHTSLLVREGLKKLEHTFAQRRKRSRKL